MAQPGRLAASEAAVLSPRWQAWWVVVVVADWAQDAMRVGSCRPASTVKPRPTGRCDDAASRTEGAGNADEPWRLRGAMAAVDGIYLLSRYKERAMLTAESSIALPRASRLHARRHSEQRASLPVWN